MHDPRPSRARPVAAWLIAAAGSAMLPACQPAEQKNTVEPPAAAPSKVPLAPAPMDREALLQAIARAASVAASGADDAAVQRQLDGKPIEVRIRFGCEGPSERLADDPLGWTYDAEEGTLRARALPTISIDDPAVAQIAGEAVEAVEGFWIARPWLLRAACPAKPAPPPGPTEAETQGEAKPTAKAPEKPAGDDVLKPVQPAVRSPKVGIAQFFTATDARTRRRDMRAYETVNTIGKDQRVGTQGFDLVLAGRLRTLPGGKVIACTISGIDAPPDCIVSAQIDQVRMERPGTKAILARWAD
jgi:hypothetical protein